MKILRMNIREIHCKLKIYGCLIDFQFSENLMICKIIFLIIIYIKINLLIQLKFIKYFFLFSNSISAYLTYLYMSLNKKPFQKFQLLKGLLN